MSQLPKGWVSTPIDNVCLKPEQRKPNDDELFSYIDIGSVDRNVKLIVSPTETIGSEAPSRARKVVNTGDILVSMTRPNLNAVAKVDAKLDGQIASTGFDVLKPVLVESDWIFAHVRSKKFIDTISGTSIGALYPACKASDIREYEIPLPPLAEQTRIVEKLDEVLAQVDTIKARLDGIPAILKRFRQSVLAAAVSGKLTGDNNSDWSSCYLSDVATFQNGCAFKSVWFNEEGDYQVIKLGNIKDDYLKLDAAPAYLDSKLGIEHIKFKPEIGDILLSMTGTKFKRDYGFCCMVDKDLPILINQRVGRIIPKRDKVSPDFLHLFLRTEVFRNQFFAGETGGVNQGNVGSKHIMSSKLFVPELALQIEIAKKSRLLFTFADTIEAQLKKAQARVDNLTQSILAKAFRGELVAQDPNDEPADKLLERIAQARIEAEALAKAGKKAETAHKKSAKAVQA